MRSLAERIADDIERHGPMRLDRFWELALFDPTEGYYATREPFGTAGDFTTAPEISQMFGELVGAWLIAAWRALGAPRPFHLVEIGPGRGTLMSDILRTAGKLDLGFLGAAQLALVETSDRLAALQAQTLARFDLPVRRLRRLEALPAGPTLLVANELFDAVAIRQFVRRGSAWHERCVGLAGEAFAFVETATEATPPGLPDAPAVEADIWEAAPARQAIAATIGQRIARDGGAALLFDYGHSEPGYGDTLQALERHCFVDPLAEPGRRDITSHVDFASIAEALRMAGAHVSPIVPQGAFLMALGLAERAETLARAEDSARSGTAKTAAERLAGIDPGGMGALFKAVAASSHPLALPPFL